MANTQMRAIFEFRNGNQIVTSYQTTDNHPTPIPPINSRFVFQTADSTGTAQVYEGYVQDVQVEYIVPHFTPPNFAKPNIIETRVTVRDSRLI